LYGEVEGLGTQAVRRAYGFQRIPLFDTTVGKPRRVRILKRTEPQVGTVVFTALRLDGGTLLHTTPLQGPRLLIVGDSITAGYGNVGAGPQCYFTPATEAGEQSWGYLVAQQLGGEALIAAFSGKGVYRNRDVTDPLTMPSLYDRVDAFDETSAEPFSTVDAVLVNLGTNDFAFANPPAEGFIASFTAYVATLRTSFPNAPILLISGPMMTDEYPTGNAARTTLRQYLEAVVSRRQQSGDKKISFLELPVQDTNGPLGCDFHPHEQVHRAMATTISEELRARLGN
ncbi:MAG: SGNH/GDSL hydrolase family protein, partial [Myxococcota bacterium]